MMVDVGEKLGLQLALDSYAQLAVDEGQADRAARLAGAAAKLRETAGTSTWPVIQRARDKRLRLARSALGEERFRKAWADGEAMTPEQAITYALHEPPVERTPTGAK
jgi:hypothetical protein